jgi:hypothetical protein
LLIPAVAAVRLDRTRCVILKRVTRGILTCGERGFRAWLQGWGGAVC